MDDYNEYRRRIDGRGGLNDQTENWQPCNDYVTKGPDYLPVGSVVYVEGVNGYQNHALAGIYSVKCLGKWYHDFKKIGFWYDLKLLFGRLNEHWSIFKLHGGFAK